MRDETPRGFAAHLHSKGIELTVRRNGRLGIWPAKSYSLLSDIEREYLRTNSRELRALVLAGEHPKLPDDAPLPPAKREESPPATCPYCMRPCVGPDALWFGVLHWNDPAEVARRSQEAAAVMMRSLSCL